jgi:hypothetical protein
VIVDAATVSDAPGAKLGGYFFNQDAAGQL